MASFESHYMLNILPCGVPMSRDSLMPFIRTTDMVRVRGIGYSLNFVLRPKSGFKIRLLMFQTLYDMRQLSESCDNPMGENKPYLNSKHSIQGGYQPNGKMLCMFKTDDNGLYRANIREEFAYLFGPQKKIYDNQPNPATIVQLMKINHPNVTVLLDCHITAINQRNKPKSFGINRIVPSKTTWKYPTLVHSGGYQKCDPEEQMPDRKVFFMVLAMPIFGTVTDPGGDMNGVVVDGDNEPTDEGPPPTFQREGSVFSEVFGPTASGSGLETIDEDGPRIPAGPATRSSTKGKEKAVPATPSKTPKAPKPVRPEFDQFPDMKLSDEAQDQMAAMVKALAFHREAEKYKRQKKAYDEDGDLSLKDVDEYGWSKYMSILFQPTFKIWWTPMVYWKFVKTARFHMKRRRSYFRRK